MIKNGDFIKLDFIGRLESGEIFDLTKEDIAKQEKLYDKNIKYGPVSIIVGEKFLLPGIEKHIIGTKVGDKKEFVLEPDNAFGKRKPELVNIMPIKVFKERKVDPKPGMIVDFGDGKKGRVQSVAAGRVTVDFNHPLAGKKLKYEIEIVDKIIDDKKKISAIFDYVNIKPFDITINNKDVIIKTNPAKLILPQIKYKISNLIMKYINAEKVVFIDEFEKPKNEIAKTTS